MAVKLIRKSDGEIIKCHGCKGERWISVYENANQYGKVICEKCFEKHTVYYDPQVYKLDQVK